MADTIRWGQNLSWEEESKAVPEEIELWNHSSVVKPESLVEISPEIFHDKHQQAIVGRPCKRESTLVVHSRVDVEDVFRVFLDQRLHERLIQNECQIKCLAIACMIIYDQMKLKTRPIKCIAFVLFSCKVVILQYLRPFHKRFNPLWSFLFQSCFHPRYYMFNIDPRNIVFLSSSLINLYQRYHYQFIDHQKPG